MAKKNITELIEEGKKIAEQHPSLELYANEVMALYEAGEHNMLNVIEATYYAALALGCQKGYLTGLTSGWQTPKRSRSKQS